MRNSFNARVGYLTLFLSLFMYLSPLEMFGQCPSRTVNGTVFVDADIDGSNDASEAGYANLQVRAFDANGVQRGQAITDANGAYNISGLVNGQSYRLEFTLSGGALVSNFGPDNAGDVQFVTVPQCGVTLGVTEGNTTCNSGTEIFLACFVNGQSGANLGQETIIGLTNSFNSSSGVSVYATQGETGSIWGMTYREATQEIFSSAFVKQHSALASGGHDAIYKTDVSGASPSTSLFTKLSSLGQNVGNLTTTNHLDCDYGDNVGRVGLGGLIQDASGDNLYVVNLFNNTVVRVDATNPTAANTQAFPVPNPGCSFNDFLVFGLKEYNGSVYVGVTCTGETSLDENDTSIHVYELNPVSGNFSLVFSDDYSQGVWSDANLVQRRTMHWLTDIDFTSNGHMILALSDRIGHSFCDDLTSRVDDQNGDILIAAKSNNGWVLESNGSIPGASGTGVNNGQGPNGGEFFGEDYFPGNPSDHPEIAIGSVYILPGTDVVVASVFDPAISAYSGGLHRYDTNTGDKVSSIELYNQNISTYFGKATGFGDITAGCGPLSGQIGNLVWFDSNCNGIQDADEQGYANVAVTLYDDNCNVVANTTTDNEGNYSFTAQDGVQTGSRYYVVLDPSNYNTATGLYDLNGAFFLPTINAGNSNINSNLVVGEACADLDNLPNVSVVVGSGNDTSFDLGLKPSTDFDLALNKVLVSSANPKFGDIVEFEIQVYNQGTVTANSFTVTDYITEAYEFVAQSNTNWNYDGSDATLAVNTPLLPNQTFSQSIFLRLIGSSNIDDLVNIAEISATVDSNGQVNSDSDSTADSNRNNDNGAQPGTPTDDLITDDGTIDEDDHDSEAVNIFDLALSKINRDNRAYDEGDIVTFDIAVFNQGNVDAREFTVTDNFPEELIFSSNGNQGWTPTGPGLIQFTYDEILAAGESVVLTVSFTVGSVTGERQLMNYAEISSATSVDNIVREDFDSVPDADMFNDNGGVPNSATDGEIFDNGITDEDDQDPASVSVRVIDLALIKTTTQQTFNLGELVTFEVEIHNQGTAVIGKLDIVDFVPGDMTLVDNSWVLDVSTGVATKEVVFLSGLQPGQIYTDEITLRINPDGHSGAYINVAEISRVYDIRNNDISSSDIDSNADAINGNDSGGMPVSAMDDYLLGTGLDDEDDSDPALIFVPTIVLQEECTCLNNATNGTNGQYRDVVAITSISGEDWYLDSAFDVFNIASPVGAPVPYATGPTGVQFREVPNGDGTSNYTLRITVVSGQGYALRTTNGKGAFLQISGGGADCTYCQPVVNSDGLGAVCAGSTHTYEAEVWQEKYENCEGFIWFVEGGDFVDVPPGTMVTGSGTGMTGSGTGLTTVTINWGSDPGPRNLTLFPSCPDICVAPVSLEVEVGVGEGLAMSCVNELNISLGDGCQSILTADQLLTSAPEPNVVYQLMLTDANGELINNNRVTETHLWSALTAKVINPCSGNSCWATINVEDKRAPKIQCETIELPCYLVNSYEPIVLDACSTAEFTLVQETTTPLTCEDPYLKVVHRTFTAVDGFGNVSSPCVQDINVLPLDYDAIDMPDEFLVAEGTSLSCLGLELDDQGFPHPSLTGIPTIHGFPLFPITDLFCNAGIDYRDILISDFGCTKKIMRTWTIYDGCGAPFRRVQTIEISDNRAPWVECPSDVTISTDGGPGCQSDYTVPLPTITDDCTTENFEIDLKYANGFLQNITAAQRLTFSAADSTEVTYQVYDGCGNRSTCSFDIFVMDEVTPTAICDQNSVVSLRLDGTAKAFPQTFDDGSFDDCALFNTLVRRMNNDCDCDRPRFSDMQYLGARGTNPNSQRHYYLSKFQRPGFKVSTLAAAYGGTLLTLESQAEHDWVYEQVNQYAPGAQYLIGLQDKNNDNTFLWENHSAPVIDLWSGEGPVVEDGDFVIVDNNAQWRVVDNDSYSYVLEISNSCGFSEEIPFCCADAGNEQMVVLRAIDYFGGYNDCVVSVEVQDKVPPQITCPQDVVMSCDALVDVNDLSSFGEASATDSCVDDNIQVDVVEDRTVCGVGTIVRTFTAMDANGGASCDQIIRFENNAPFNFATIIWPEDFDTDEGCNFTNLHPDNLDAEFAFPQFPGTDRCDLLDAAFTDQVFSFSGPGSTDCLKILRQWTVIDWCQLDDDGVPMSMTYDQTIKVQSTEAPTIESSCSEPLEVVTLECLEADVSFQVTATDDCTLASSLKNCVNIDLKGDGDFEVIDNCEIGGTVFFQNKLPLGNHILLISFEDLCGNVSSCTKPISVRSEKAPTAYCVESLTVALEPWDSNGDGTMDNEIACITPDLLDRGSTHLCNDLIRQQNASLPAGQQLDTIQFDISFCNSADPNEICFDCRDRDSTRTVQLCVIDEFGQQSTCNVRIGIQDNNNINACPVFDLALIKEIAPGGPATYNPGDDVTFRLVVLNQGTVDAENVQIAEYIPDGLSLNDPDWALFPGTNTAILNTPIDTVGAGWSKFVELTLSIDANSMLECYTNFAEIIGSQNAMDLPDEDSVADTDQTNDIFRDDSDNVVDEDGLNGGDEDDHDFAKVFINQVYDLALSKNLSAGQPVTFMPGDEVCFDISVINQGTLDATNVNVDDNIPAGLTFNSGSPWTLSGDVAQTTIPFVAANGGVVTTEICFIIQDGFMGQCLINVAEIAGQGESTVDADSTPGNDDGDQSEDDEDSAKVAVGQVFDLALRKVLASGGTTSFNPGDIVTFNLEVFNQGTLDATNVIIQDYVPSDLIFSVANNPGWNANGTFDLGNVPAGTNSPIIVPIALEISPSFVGSSITNDAEIISADNDLGLPDVDSTPGNDETPDDTNDNDDITDTDGGDDQDPEVIVVVCDIPPVCSVLPQITVSLDTFGVVTVMPEELGNTSMSVCDNLPPILEIITNTTFSCADLFCSTNETQVITVRVTDQIGNNSTCSTSVTVEDNIAPFFLCSDVTVPVDENGNPIVDFNDVVSELPGFTIQDNCIGLTPSFSAIGSLPCVANPATYTLTDQCGLSTTCNFNVFLENDPPVALCQDVTLNLDGNGMAVITVAMVDNGSTDDCGIDTRVVSPTNYDCTQVGVAGLTTTLTVTDISGAVSTCTANVTVNDTTPPTAICRNFAVCLDVNGQASIIADSINNNSTDNCPTNLSLSIDRTMFTCDDLENSPVPVTLSVFDGVNTSVSTSCSVTVQDKEAPILICQDATVFLDSDTDLASLDASMIIVSLTDNCGGVLETTLSRDEFNCSDLDQTVTTEPGCPGRVEVTLSATDGTNTAECTQTVSVKDNTIAVCSPIVDIDVMLLGAGTTASVTVDASTLFTVVNNCNTTSTFEPATFTFDCTDIGANPLTVSVGDGCGHTTVCNTAIDILDGAPQCLAQTSVTLSLDNVGNLPISLASVDAGSSAGCDGAISVSPTNFTCDDLGTNNIVTITVTPLAGTPLTCQTNVTVVDDLAPVVVCDNVIVNLDASGVATVDATFLTQAISDNCPDNLTTTIGQSSFDCNDLGDGVACLSDEILVTITVTDGSMNTATCESQIRVRDQIGPECPTPMTIQQVNLLGAGTTAVATINAVDVWSPSDNCSTVFAFGPNVFNFDCTDIGVQTITAIVSDECGQNSNCTAQIEIIDSEPQCVAIPDVTFNLGANGTFNVNLSDVDAGSSAGCDGAIAVSPNTFTCDDIGTDNSVTITVTPLSGMALTCLTNVTIVDNLAPQVTCRDRLLSLDEFGVATVDPDFLIESVTDNCPDELVTTISQNSFDCDDLSDDGTGCISDEIEITVIAIDASMNMDTCISIIQVRDLISPECPTPTIVQQVSLLGAGTTATAMINPEEIWSPTDNCSTEFTFTPGVFSFDCNDIGVQTVTSTVRDECGRAASCTAEVEVVDSAPQCQAIPNVTFNLDPAGNFNVTLADVDAGSSAGCDGDISISPTFFACNNVGLDNCVTITVTPFSGTEQTCKSNVTIVDQTPPVLTCDPFTVILDQAAFMGGNLATVAEVITADDLNLTIFDCDTASIILSQSIFDCNDLIAGPNNCTSNTDVIITVTDGSGNASTCVSTVTVEDAIAPTCTALQGVVTPLIMQAGGMLGVTIDPMALVADFDDNCFDATFTASAVPAMFDCNDLNTTQDVTITVTDQCGLEGTCVATVNIIENSVPICLIQDITIPLNGDTLCLSPSAVDAGSNAGCGAPVVLDVSPSKFDCTTLGANVVTLTVSTTPPGTIQSASCTATVTVIDNALPIINCPADMTVACNTSLFNPNVFGSATATDGCNAQLPAITTFSPVLNVNACNVGVLTRTFTATDLDGNSASCTQIVTIDGPVNPLTAVNITFPPSPFVLDTCIVDPTNVDSGMPIVDTSNLDCTLISISSVTIDPTPNSGSTCVNELERTWTVIDSCQLNAGTGAGIFTFTQSIILNDVQGPDIECPGDTLVFLPVNASACEVMLNLPATITDCTGVISGSNNSPFATTMMSSDASGLYPVGTTNVTVTGEDNCGNISTCSYEVMVVDTSATFDSCKKLIVNLGPTGMTTVNSVAACPELTSICPATSFTVSWSIMDPSLVEMDFDCGDQTTGITTMYTLYLYSENELLDSCSNILQVLDAFSVCPQPFTNGTISGRIQTEDSRTVSDVGVVLNTMELTDLTASDGVYAFAEIPFNNPYQVVPSKNIDPLNGVSTLDLVLMQRHILSIEKLDSPYKIIAADINRSDDVNGIDLVELRKLILGITTEFPQNTSWRMVDAAYEFIDDTNPFAAFFPESYVIRNFANDMEIDFIGVKIGDVNSDVVANLTDVALERRRSTAVNLMADDVITSENSLIDVDFSITENVDGFQFTMEYDVDKMTFVGIHSQSQVLLETNYHMVTPGVINFSWHNVNARTQVDLTDLFTMRFVSHSGGRLSEVISISETGINPEAYIEDDVAELRLDLESGTSEELEVYQNSPNPWTSATEISFSLPEASDFSLEILNTDGKLVYTLAATGNSGLNTVDITKSDLPTGGVYYYVITNNGVRKTEKMLFVR